ncbi:MAG: energy-coupling factor transporter transmembrane protein EcfT [Treponema sp.]|jgi:energy-coupling factor transporter transmembrane protein EcfT|nr:energy-coupling factor transporter transmembrane protein EcfT [Treponema sp.]
MLKLFNYDPRVKIILVLLFTVLIFLVDKPALIVCLLLSFLFLRVAAGVHLHFKGVFKNVFTLVVFMVLLQGLFAPGENYIIKPLFPHSFPFLGGMGSLKLEGLYLGLIIGCRIFALMLLLPFLTDTTPAHRIATALGAFGIDYRVSFIITTALNLIPLLAEEGRAIMDAQRLRGMRSFERRSFERRSFERRSFGIRFSFFAKFKAYPGIVIPLVLGAMRKAQKTGIAMDARAFGVYKTRTWLEKPVMKKNDYFLLFFCVFFFAAVLTLNYLLH